MILYQGRSYKSTGAWARIGAMKQGSRDRYFQGDVTEAEKLVPEGIEGRVPYQGSVEMTIFQLVGGLRAGMGYLRHPEHRRAADQAALRRASRRPACARATSTT